MPDALQQRVRLMLAFVQHEDQRPVEARELLDRRAAAQAIDAAGDHARTLARVAHRNGIGIDLPAREELAECVERVVARRLELLADLRDHLVGRRRLAASGLDRRQLRRGRIVRGARHAKKTLAMPNRTTAAAAQRP